MKKTTDIHNTENDKVNIPDATVDDFLEAQEESDGRHGRNARKALDRYLEKKRLRTHLTFFDIDEDSILSTAANEP